MSSAGHAHLVIGPVGAGKSTLVRRLTEERGALGMVLDEWMARLYGGDARPESGRVEWYLERRERCREQMWAVALGACAAGCEVVLELGLIRRAEREDAYRRIEEARCASTVHLIDAPRGVRFERVMRRNVERGPTFAQVVPPEIFDRASDLWEPPDDDEIRHRGILVL